MKIDDLRKRVEQWVGPFDWQNKEVRTSSPMDRERMQMIFLALLDEHEAVGKLPVFRLSEEFKAQRDVLLKRFAKVEQLLESM